MFRTLLVTALLLGAVAVANAQIRVTATPVPADLFRGSLTPQMAPDYSNTTNSTGFYYPGGAGAIVADDVHRTTSLPIGQVSFAYYAPTSAPDVTLYIYQNNGDFNLPASLIASYPLGTLNGSGGWIYTITLPAPLTAPADLWIGFSFSAADAGLLIYNPPTVGTSHDLFTINNGGPYWFGGNPVANFYLETVPVPEPASLLVLGSGVVGLLALRRRRA
ncbi:MAG: hypothetical protein KatS3mg023_3145 [Armatimonadota bacterium]|nr:MAG: hypothetical protein KatS3mg023_3145 [Armatimonadota bacterium]